MFETGCGSAVITPRTGLQMGGYSGMRIAEGVHDDLMAKAVYLADGPENCMMLIVVDTLEVDRHFVDEVRRRVEQETGVPAACCLVAAIHTHSGPAGLGRVAFQTPRSLGLLTRGCSSGRSQDVPPLPEKLADGLAKAPYTAAWRGCCSRSVVIDAFILLSRCRCTSWKWKQPHDAQ